jgi:hypothetical protein
LEDAEARALLEEPFLIAAIRVKMFLMIVFNNSIHPHSFHPHHDSHTSLIHCDVVLVIGDMCVALILDSPYIPQLYPRITPEQLSFKRSANAMNELILAMLAYTRCWHWLAQSCWLTV